MPSALFVHNGTPGRFGFLARELLARGWTGALLNDAGGNPIEGLTTVIRAGATEPPSSDPLLRDTEVRLRAGTLAAEAAATLAQNGFRPDVIIGHPGWGEMLFLREIWPDARQIQIGEFYYGTRGTHFNFDPIFPAHSLTARTTHIAGNAALALSHAQADRIVAPTPFQAGTFPKAFAPIIRVIHEGIDTDRAHPVAGTRIRLPNGVLLDGTTPVITFINRRFEPLRGFLVFMRALPRLLAALPDAQILIVGMDDPHTYYMPSASRSWKQAMLAELDGQIDPDRVHFLGALPYPQLIALFSVSSAHVYLTYPFVLSWSLLDAMACECLIVGSDTAPVRDVVRHGENGLLVPFFDQEALTETLIEACRKPERFRPLRRAARATVLADYDRDRVCLPQWLALIDEVVGGAPPGATRDAERVGS